MGLGGGGRWRGLAIVGALLMARCDLSPHPEDPGFRGSDKGTSGGSSQHASDAGSPFINGHGGSSGTTASGSGGAGAAGVPPIHGVDAGRSTRDAGTSRPDGGNDSGPGEVEAGADANADAADGR